MSSVPVRMLSAAAAAAVAAMIFDQVVPYMEYRPTDAGASPKPLSPVVTDGTGWENEGYLIPHEPIRRDIARLRAALNTPEKPIAPWFYSCFAPQLSLHAKSEDDFFLEYFASRGAKAGTRDLRGDHRDIEAFLTGRVEEQQLREGLPGFLDLLEAHLNEEEELFRPLFGTTISHDDWKAAVRKSHKAFTLSESALVLPHIMDSMSDWAGPQRQAAQDASLPWFLRQLLHRFWLPGYYAAHIDRF